MSARPSHGRQGSAPGAGHFQRRPMGVEDDNDQANQARCSGYSDTLCDNNNYHCRLLSLADSDPVSCIQLRSTIAARQRAARANNTPNNIESTASTTTNTSPMIHQHQINSSSYISTNAPIKLATMAFILITLLSLSSGRMGAQTTSKNGAKSTPTPSNDINVIYSTGELGQWHTHTHNG